MDRIARAKRKVNKASKLIADAERFMWVASKYMEGTPEEHRIKSLALGLERLKEFVEEQEGRLE